MSKDMVRQNGKWIFNYEVASCFDDMLSRSIPLYEIMRKLSNNLAAEYAIPNTPILDIGCSLGGAIRELNDDLKLSNTFIGIDNSMDMILEAKKNFKDQTNIVFIHHDLREGLPEIPAPSVVLSILTLQFIPVECRQKLIKEIFNTLREDGAFVFVEKVLGNSAEHEETFTKLYYQLKEENGYSYEDIKRKRYNLEGVLVPSSTEWNYEMLRTAGFRKIDIFWKWLNFCGWIAIK